MNHSINIVDSLDIPLAPGTEAEKEQTTVAALVAKTLVDHYLLLTQGQNRGRVVFRDNLELAEVYCSFRKWCFENALIIEQVQKILLAKHWNLDIQRHSVLGLPPQFFSGQITLILYPQPALPPPPLREKPLRI